jgi:hypothetical protein
VSVEERDNNNGKSRRRLQQRSTFHSEMYQDNIFFIFEKLFLTSAHQNDLKTQKILI